MNKKKLASELIKVAKDLVGVGMNEEYHRSELFPILKKINKIGGKYLEADSNGTLFLHMDNDSYLYVTPFWDGARGIAYQLTDADGDILSSGVIPFKPAYDVGKDVKEYVKKVKTLIPKLSR